MIHLQESLVTLLLMLVLKVNLKNYLKLSYSIFVVLLKRIFLVFEFVFYLYLTHKLFTYLLEGLEILMVQLPR